MIQYVRLHEQLGVDKETDNGHSEDVDGDMHNRHSRFLYHLDDQMK